MNAVPTSGIFGVLILLACVVSGCRESGLPHELEVFARKLDFEESRIGDKGWVYDVTEKFDSRAISEFIPGATGYLRERTFSTACVVLDRDERQLEIGYTFNTTGRMVVSGGEKAINESGKVTPEVALQRLMDQQTKCLTIVNNDYSAMIERSGDLKNLWFLINSVEHDGFNNQFPFFGLYRMTGTLRFIDLADAGNVRDVSVEDCSISAIARGQKVSFRFDPHQSGTGPSLMEAGRWSGVLDMDRGCLVSQTFVDDEGGKSFLDFEFDSMGQPLSATRRFSGKGLSMDYKFQVKSVTKKIELTQDAAYLSHYGLGEPNGVKRPSKRRAWVFAAAFFVLGLGGVCLARSKWASRGGFTHRAGFTLVELLAVLAVIAILMGMLLPAVQMIRESARRTACENRVRQIGLGLLNFESALQKFPSGITAHKSQTFLQAILPFVEQAAVFDRAVQDYNVKPSPFAGHLGLQTLIDTFQCPSELDSGELHWTHENKLVACTSYLGVNGTDWERKDGVFYLESKTRFSDIADGASCTLMVGERPASPDFWYGWWYTGNGQQGTGSCDMLLGVRERKAPAFGGITTYLESCPDGPYQYQAGKYGEQCDTFHFWSYHPGGAVFALCDGSVRLISYDANDIMPALATRDGGEAVNVPE